jgi:Spy/CpxP family protein refolding chaperone
VNRPKWQAIGSLLGVFALGAVAGGGALAAWHGKHRRDMAETGFGMHGERPMLAMMRRLGLTEQQRQAIEDVLEKHAPKRRAIMQDIMAKCGREFDQEKDALDAEIRAILTEEQRARFEDLSTRQRERMFGPHPGHAR